MDRNSGASTPIPSPFSPTLPNLQVAWDATSLKALMECPRKYKLSIIDGWRKSGVHVEFGGFFAYGTEVYRRSRLAGADKLAATVGALRAVIERTFDPIIGPWGGSYANMWCCTGTEKYKNSAGNRAKCPFSKKGAWFPGDAPVVCGTCGSDTVSERRWVPNDKVKNRVTLVRLLAWWIEEQPEMPGGVGLYPIAFPDGTPAVELNLRMTLPFGFGQFSLVANLDSVSSHGHDQRYITDNKTTNRTLDGAYWAQYSPHVQVDVYDLIGATMLKDLNVGGVAIEGATVSQSGAQFGINIYRNSPEHREELLHDLEYWIGQAEKFAVEGEWPMNRASCFLCGFKRVCSAEPDRREAILAEAYEQRKWNPLAER